jgi:ribulose-5-phosphate 4-epimerase/fuculose-1-phosphate aldolase
MWYSRSSIAPARVDRPGPYNRPRLTHADFRHTVALACRILALQGLVKETTGHVSARIPGTDRMLIRARGRDESGLLFTRDEEIIETDFDGSDVPRDAPLGTPQELPIHGESYKARPEVGAVVHAHPPAILLCGIAGLELRPIFGAYDPSAMLLALDGVPVYPRSITLTRPELAQDMLACMGERDVCVLRGHGITVLGRSVEEATVKAIKLETLARINWLARDRHVPDISQQDQAVFRSPERAGRRGALAVWRSYVAMLDLRSKASPFDGI